MQVTSQIEAGVMMLSRRIDKMTCMFKRSIANIQILRADAFDRTANQVPLESEREFFQRRRVEGYEVRIFLHHTFLPRIIHRLNNDLMIASQRTGRAPDHFANTWIV